jgi:hypothetical protein
MASFIFFSRIPLTYNWTTTKMTDPLLQDLMVLRMAVSSRDVESEWDKLVALAESIVQRGVKKSIAEWEADSDFGTENTLSLCLLGSTREHEKGLELLAQFAANSLKMPGFGTPAETIQAILASPQGMDVAHATIHLKALGQEVRTQRIARLYGYALSGKMEQDLKHKTGE